MEAAYFFGLNWRGGILRGVKNAEGCVIVAASFERVMYGHSSSAAILLGFASGKKVRPVGRTVTERRTAEASGFMHTPRPWIMIME